jgi:hypothetical protein
MTGSVQLSQYTPWRHTGSTHLQTAILDLGSRFLDSCERAASHSVYFTPGDRAPCIHWIDGKQWCIEEFCGEYIYNNLIKTGFTHLQIERNPSLEGYRPQIPVLAAPVLNWICWITPRPNKIPGYTTDGRVDPSACLDTLEKRYTTWTCWESHSEGTVLTVILGPVIEEFQ